jgi:hypothetical protein
MSLEACLPRFSASLRVLKLQMHHLGDPSEIRDLTNVQLPNLEKLDLTVITIHGFSWLAWCLTHGACLGAFTQGMLLDAWPPDRTAPHAHRRTRTRTV